MKIQDIRHAIKKLTPLKLVPFRDWFERNANFNKPVKLANREYIHSLRGKYRGKGLMKALMADKKRERDDDIS